MDLNARSEFLGLGEGFAPVERVAGSLEAGALVICDHASNAIPLEFANLGLRPAALERHIAYDIGAADLTRALARRLGAPAVLSTFSRLLIDPNRGADDPTLVMRYSDGAIVPGNANVAREEVERRIARFWSPYRDAVAATASAMIEAGRPPAILSIHTFTPIWRGAARPWKVGVLWDADPRLPAPLLAALAKEPDLARGEIGDNEPYDGALLGDTIDGVATARGLANALIEVRQDLVAERAGAEAWAQRLARLVKPLVAPEATRIEREWGSRAATKAHLRSADKTT